MPGIFLKNKRCPKCQSRLDHLDRGKASRQDKWYQPVTLRIFCPYCGVELKVGKYSQVIVSLVLLVSLVTGTVAGEMEQEHLKICLYLLSGFLFLSSLIALVYFLEYIEVNKI